MSVDIVTWLTVGVVAVGSIVIILFMLRAVRHRGYPAKTFRGLRSYRGFDDTIGLAGAIVATTALLSFFQLAGSVPQSALLLAGGALGVSAALAPAGFTVVLFWLCALAGYVGIVGGLFNPSCDDGSLVSRIGMVSVLLLAAAVGGVVATFGKGVQLITPLSGFAALEIVVFLVSPYGFPLAVESPLYALAALVIAAVLGFATVAWAQIILTIGAVAVTLMTIGVTAGLGDACGVRGFEGLISLLAVTGAFVVCRAFRRRRFR